MKWLFIFLLIFSVLLSAAEKTDKIARLHYKGGGDWYNDQDIIPNIAAYLNKTLETNFSQMQAEVKPDDRNISDFPFIFMTGHGAVHFNEQEIENLRNYLYRGGFLYIDDDYGMDESIRKEIDDLFPEKTLVELPASHLLFHCYNDFENGLPKIHKHDNKRPQAFGIFDKYGRLMLLYTYETNISDGWSNVHNDPEVIRKKAFKFGANLFYYVMTN